MSIAHSLNIINLDIIDLIIQSLSLSPSLGF